MSVWWRPSRARDVQPLPWLSPEAVAFLESLLQPDFEVLEHGSGGSTLWFAERVKQVTAYEEDDNWRRAVKEKAPDNVRLFSLTGMRAKFKFIEDAEADLLLIDGDPVEDRAEWLKNAPSLVKPGGYVVLDNANRPEYVKERKELTEYADLIEVCDGNEGGTRYLVTEFYKTKGQNGKDRKQPE